mmetsp:Transcript_2606/g.9346  ORF Transcript_2606/g.9346 Transcript_2606/m.9346 type:complete len:227 (-) Transcript_2606:346-1026(-)
MGYYNITRKTKTLNSCACVCVHVRTVQKQRFFSFVFSIRRRPFFGLRGRRRRRFRLWRRRGLLFIRLFLFLLLLLLVLLVHFVYQSIRERHCFHVTRFAEQRRSLHAVHGDIFYDNQRRRNHHHDGIFRLVNLVRGNDSLQLAHVCHRKRLRGECFHVHEHFAGFRLQKCKRLDQTRPRRVDDDLFQPQIKQVRLLLKRNREFFRFIQGLIRAVIRDDRPGRRAGE